MKQLIHRVFATSVTHFLFTNQPFYNHMMISVPFKLEIKMFRKLLCKMAEKMAI